MAETKHARTGTPKPAKRTSVVRKASKVFTKEERDAMVARAQEVKAARRSGARGNADDERDVLAKIADMPQPDRALAERLHAVIKSAAPDLSPKLWYGMPAYARAGKIVCHFISAQKFGTRYATIGFSDKANLDEGALWPVAFALEKLAAAEEATIRALLKKAVS